MRRIGMVALALALLGGCAEKQLTPDEMRIRDVHAIADMVERFHAKTGRYPLAERVQNEPVKVSITKTNQTLFGALSSRVLETELRGQLGKDITLPTDPGSDPWRSKIGYHYTTDGRDYTVSAYLQEASALTRTTGHKIHTYEVGSLEIPEYRIWNHRKMLAGGYAHLMQQP